jgi:alkylation response protein AidB-like acyl-CoA dehydrogenase
MDARRIFKGGEFLVAEVTKDEVFTPEDLSDEQRQIAQTARDFIADQVFPKLEEIERQDFPVSVDLMRTAGELGLLMTDAIEDSDRQGLGKVATTVVADHSGIAGSFSVVMAAHSGLGTLPLMYYGSEEQRARYLDKLTSGEWIAAFCLTEPQAGSDALQPRTTAELSLDATHYVLNGTKQFITNARIATFFTVFASFDDGRVAAFLVERDTPGLSIGPEEKKLGIKGSSTCQVILDRAKVPVENLLGEQGEGHKIALNVLNVGRLKLAAAVTGAARGELAYGLRYANQRKQFGKTIGSFGAIKEKIADATARIFASESLVYRLAGHMDDRLSDVARDCADLYEAYRKGVAEYAPECSIAKVYCSEMLAAVADDVLELYGGYGYTTDYPAERFYRDERINRIFEGTNEINRLLITGLVLRRSMQGKLPLQGEAVKAFDALLSPSFEELDVDTPFVKEKALIKDLKTLFLAIAGAAAQKFQEALAEEEEILTAAADLMIEIFALESAVLRADKLFDEASDRKRKLLAAVAKICAFAAAERAGTAGRRAAFYVEDGDALLMLLSGARRFSKFDATGLLEAKRLVADAAEEREQYPF